MEDHINELKEKNKKLKAELKESTKSNSHSTKGHIRNANDWTCEEANLADKITEFCKDYLIPCYELRRMDGRLTIQRTRRAFAILLGRLWLTCTKI